MWPFKSDPYAVIQLGDSSCTTRVINNNLNPVWDETFYLYVRWGAVMGGAGAQMLPAPACAESSCSELQGTSGHPLQWRVGRRSARGRTVWGRPGRAYQGSASSAVPRCAVQEPQAAAAGARAGPGRGQGGSVVRLGGWACELPSLFNWPPRPVHSTQRLTREGQLSLYPLHW